MKLDRIQIENFLGAHHIDVKMPTPVTLFAGPNGAAKSSICEAVRMAMTGAVVRVKGSKEFEQLVTDDGSKQGGAMVTMSDSLTYAFTIPSGDRKIDDGLPVGDSVDVCLNGQRFSTMDEDARRTFLFKVAGVRFNAADIKPRLLTLKCDVAKVDMVLPLLRTGFPDAAKFAATKATEAKGAWRQVTGGTYGKNVAQAWKAELPFPPEADAPAADAIPELDKKIAALNTSIGAINAEAAARRDAAAKRAQLKEQADSVARVRENLIRVQGELAEYEPKVVVLRQRASGNRPVGLIHDLAYFLNRIEITNEDDRGNANDLIDRYEDAHGCIPTGGAIAVDADATASLPEFERGLEVLQNSVKNLTRDVQSAEAAKAQFDLLSESAAAPELEDATALQEQLAELKLQRAATMLVSTEHAEYAGKIATAKKRTEDAAGHHATVVAWTVVAEALSADGIPAQLLKEALTPINKSLQEAADLTGWKKVSISQELAVTSNGRPYHLLSESEKWRADATIAVTVARLSGIKILMLDRVDVLDMPGRGALLAWVNTLVTDGDIDTALLFATLKALPAQLYPSMSAHWVEGGAIAQLKEAA